ncbi:MAG TPA: TauD/TfdA family dioxygenase [Gemmatimonadaceae bacterium]
MTNYLPAFVDAEVTIREALCAVGVAAGLNSAWWHGRDALRRHLPERALGSLIESVHLHLQRGSGAVVVRLGPAVSPDSVRLLQLVLGESLGSILTIAPDEPGRPLFRISAVEGADRTGEYVGNAKKRSPIGFHTDGSGVASPIGTLSMACIRPASRGGETRLSDAKRVHARLSDPARRVLEAPQPRENPYRRLPPDELVVLPVFDPLADLAFSYHPSRLRNGIQAVRGGLSEPETAALAELEGLLEAAAIELLLLAGDILMIDNRRLAHDRRLFIDDPASPRLLERLWIGLAV